MSPALSALTVKHGPAGRHSHKTARLQENVTSPLNMPGAGKRRPERPPGRGYLRSNDNALVYQVRGGGFAFGTFYKLKMLGVPWQSRFGRAAGGQSDIYASPALGVNV